MEEKSKDTGTPPASTFTTTTVAETPPKTATSEPPSSRRRGGGQKRKASNNGNSSNPSTTSSSKRQAREKFLAIPFQPIHNGPWTRARQQPNNAGAASVYDASSSAAVVKSEAEPVAPPGFRGGEVVKVEEELSPAKEDWEALEAKIGAEYEVIRSRDVNAHVVPIPSGWFSWTKVHQLEERALPSFFNGKSKNRTPEMYTEIRNWIMNKFHANPNVQIELKDLSELTVGELDARQEVMEFLDYWGLINYHPFPQTDSAASNADDDGEAKMGSLVEKLYHFEKEQSSAQVAPRTNVATPTVPSRLFPESAITEELARLEGPSVEYHCNSCSADCSRKRYHCQKQADFDLCIECFGSGKFGSDMSPSDFILMEPAEAAGASGGTWTDQETLLLLEALELFKENWNEIAEHVATKTKAQCILHFVQMPIEDTFLDCNDEIEANLKENADPVSTDNDTSAKEAPEITESKDGASDNLPLSSPMEISKPDDASEPKVSQEIGENCALKALREAFEAVGSLPSPEELLSFAEAGNPVMALAAFLVRLVEPDVVTASARTSLNSISGNSSAVQLAARHCFLLEDPPDDKKKPVDSERDTAETVEQECQKDENQNDEMPKGEKSKRVFNNSDSSNDHDNEEKKDSVTEEKGVLVSPDGECTDKSHAAEQSDVVTHEEVEPALLNKSDNPDFPMEQAPSTVEESDDLMSKVELLTNPAKELGDGASGGGPSQATDAPKVEELVSDSLPSEKKEPEQPITSNSMVEKGENTGEEEAKDCKNENKDPFETKKDMNIDKLKCASVTAIAAAAVKAKILASQEEDQIRQLATLLIEKQLHKLETKLAFFAEMESVVMRVKEQLERSKQRLYHERAQIIAARLGISASSSRPIPQSLPANRAAMTFANSGSRPPMNMMTSQRPTISRPIMASSPPTSNPFVPATVAGNSVPPSNQDKLASVGMK